MLSQNNIVTQLTSSEFSEQLLSSKYTIMLIIVFSLTFKFVHMLQTTETKADILLDTKMISEADSSFLKSKSTLALNSSTTKSK